MNMSVKHDSSGVLDAPLILSEPPPRPLGLASNTAFWWNLGISLLLPVAAVYAVLPNRALWVSLLAIVVGAVIGGVLLGLAAPPGAREGVPGDGAAAWPARRPGIVPADGGEPGPVRGMGDVRDRGDRRSRLPHRRRATVARRRRRGAGDSDGSPPAGRDGAAGAVRGLGRPCRGGVSVRPGSSHWSGSSSWPTTCCPAEPRTSRRRRRPDRCSWCPGRPASSPTSSRCRPSSPVPERGGPPGGPHASRTWASTRPTACRPPWSASVSRWFSPG